MTNGLPSALDMTSAQVLGFDASAYIAGKPSTLHQRLNIPNSYTGGDYFTSDRAVPSKGKKNPLPAIVASALSLVGLGILTRAALKGKIKFNIPNKLSKFGTKIVKICENGFNTVSDFATKLLKKVKK